MTEIPTKRTRRPRYRVGGTLPAWARHWLLTGEEPGEPDPGFDQWFGFAFCGEEVVGLGRMLTEDDAARIDALRKEIRRAHKAQTRTTADVGA